VTENLLPAPRAARALAGHFELGAQTVVTGDAADVADVVRRALATWPLPAGGGGDIQVSTDASLAAEGYQLLIGPDHIRIAAGGPAGAFYAAQTLRQLAPDNAWRVAPAPGAGLAWTIGCAEISDEPALAWRGAHLDVARHFFPKPVVLRFIDMLAAHKLNRLHLHLTDDQGWRIESRRYPALPEVGSWRAQTQVGKDRTVFDGVPHGGYYTLADLAEIHAYAAERMVTVIPEVEVPGHARAFLAALPALAAAPGTREQSVACRWGIFEEIMSPLPATLDVLGELFGELLGVIPAPFVHIGGDECVLTDWKSDPAIASYQQSLGLASADALHAYFLRQVADLLATSYGARAIVWDEGFTSAAGLLREDTVVMPWHGMEIGLAAARAGHDIVATPEDVTYFDHAQSADPREPLSIGGLTSIEDVAAFAPVPAEWPVPETPRLLGAQFQLWTEYIKDARRLDYMTFPRASAFAEVAWSGKPSPWEAGLSGRVAAQLRRLDAAGVEYRPLTGPHPWQLPVLGEVVASIPAASFTPAASFITQAPVAPPA
jgi:hexosaminidase